MNADIIWRYLRHSLWGLLLVLAACKTPIGVTRVGPDRAYAQVNANVLTSGELSGSTQAVLHRYDLRDRYAEDPIAVIQMLDERVRKDRRRDILFALAELSLDAGEQKRRRSLGEHEYLKAEKGASRLVQKNSVEFLDPAAQPYFLASSVYAYLYLFGRLDSPLPGAFDRDFRLACDIYCRGLMEALRTEAPQKAGVGVAERKLPVGKIQLRITRPSSLLEGLIFEEFVPADDYLVRGLSRRDRTPGLGAPFIGIVSESKAAQVRTRPIAADPKIPITVLLRLDDASCDLSQSELTGSLELYTPFTDREVRLGGQTVPLEADPTAVLAYGLQSSKMWSAEYAQLISSEQRFKTGLYTFGPYEPGKVPVVFVHGTASSPARWGEMFNTLYADRAVREHCQFWYFIYTTGNPILYSASLLRDSLRDVVQSFDPDGRDPALKNMVVIGHSQGGLLTRIVASSNQETWAGLSRDSIAAMGLNEQQGKLVEQSMFFEPSPYIRRVVFIATPHQGSYRVGGFIQWLAQRMFQLPGEIVNASVKTLKSAGEGKLELPLALRTGVPTSIANMKPGSSFVKCFCELRLSSDIKSHSVIAVKPGGAIETGNDGVVAYTSAHIDTAESEFIVRGPHSCQDYPSVIEEVRRILLLHLKSSPVALAPGSKGAGGQAEVSPP